MGERLEVPTLEQMKTIKAGPQLDMWVDSVVFDCSDRMSVGHFICPKCQGTCFGTVDCFTEESDIMCHGHAIHHPTWSEETGGCGWQGSWDEVSHPQYSKKIELAFSVLARMQRAGYSYGLWGCSIISSAFIACCAFIRGINPPSRHSYDNHSESVCIYAETEAEAICVAAIMAKLTLKGDAS